MNRKSFIRAECLGVVISPVGENRLTMTSRFLQCLKLGEYIAKKPENFIYELWESEDKKTWVKISETIYEGVIWHGNVHHTDGDEMSACHGSIEFTYNNCKVENCSFQNINVDKHLFDHEFIELTV